jgi:hypothetical protein
VNGTEQRQRHTAVQTVEKRIDDLETLIMGLAQQLVEARSEQERQMHQLVDSVNSVLDKGHKQQQLYIDAGDDGVRERFVAFATRGFWQRFRWLFLGR